MQLLNYRSGVELARCFLQKELDNPHSPSDPQTPNPQGPNSQGCPSWCKCNNSCHMDNPTERVCCKKYPCVTTSDLFYNICLNRHVSAVCIINRLGMTLNLIHLTIEKLPISSTLCTNMATWEVVIGKLSLRAWIEGITLGSF